MGYFEEQEEKELDEKYPEGSKERRALDYSRAIHHHKEEVPPMLVAAFKVLMGITAVMALVGFIGFLSH